MGYCKIKVTRTRTETVEVDDVELEGTNNDEIDDSLTALENDEQRKAKLLEKIKDSEWELEDESHDFEVEDYSFDEDKDDD